MFPGLPFRVSHEQLDELFTNQIKEIATTLTRDRVEKFPFSLVIAYYKTDETDPKNISLAYIVSPDIPKDKDKGLADAMRSIGQVFFSQAVGLPIYAGWAQETQDFKSSILVTGMSLEHESRAAAILFTRRNDNSIQPNVVVYFGGEDGKLLARKPTPDDVLPPVSELLEFYKGVTEAIEGERPDEIEILSHTVTDHAKDTGADKLFSRLSHAFRVAKEFEDKKNGAP